MEAGNGVLSTSQPIGWHNKGDSRTHCVSLSRFRMVLPLECPRLGTLQRAQRAVVYENLIEFEKELNHAETYSDRVSAVRCDVGNVAGQRTRGIGD